MARFLTAVVFLALLLASSSLSAAADSRGGTGMPGAASVESEPDPWIRGLQEPDERVRLQTAMELRDWMEPRYVEPLAALLEDQSPQVRYMAVQAICEARHPLAIGPLASFIRRPDGNGCLRSNAARSLGQINDPCAVAALLALLGDQDLDVVGRTAAVFGLAWGIGEGTILERAAEEALIIAEDDPVPGVRAAARDMRRFAVERRKDLAMLRPREGRAAAQPPNIPVK